MASTHKTVKSSGGGDYTTIGAAVAASSSGSAGDYSTITILDSSTYNESITISSLQYLRLTAAAGQTPTIAHGNNPLILSGTADHIEVIGASDTSRLTLYRSGGGSGYPCLSIRTAPLNFKAQYLTYKQQGSGDAIDNDSGSIATGAWDIEDCGIAGPATLTDVIGGGGYGINSLTMQRCDLTGASVAGYVVHTNRFGGTINRVKASCLALIRAYGGFGVDPAGKWVITNNIIVGGTAGFGVISSLNTGIALQADIYNNTLINPGAAGAAGTTYGIYITGTTTGINIKNNGIVGFGTGIYSGSAITVYNNGFYACTTNRNVNVTSTAQVLTDPLLDANYAPQTGSPWIDAGTNDDLTEDYAGHVRPIGTAYDIGAWELDLEPPDLDSALPDGNRTIHVTFSEVVIGADLEDQTAWTVTAPFDSGATVITVLSVTCDDGIHGTLVVTPMGPDTLYRVTCPDTLTDLFGNLIDVTTADFVTPKDWGTESESGNPWGAVADGSQFLTPPFELVTWDASLPSASLDQAVWMSLFSDRRASDDDTLPDTSGSIPYKGGWWADTYSDGDQFGSRLWLLRSSPVNSETIKRVKEYALESLEWLITDGIAARVDVVAERTGIDGISLSVTAYRQDGQVIGTVHYDSLWDAWR